MFLVGRPRGGICIWAASYPRNIACVRSGVNSGSLSRGSGVKLTHPPHMGAHHSQYGMLLQGVGTPIRRGFMSISLLKWSPTRDYFFSAKCDGTFYLWETNTWTSELFS
ncbi:hypothetical protein LXL04_019342 [Taraxacum kok-saghyz]